MIEVGVKSSESEERMRVGRSGEDKSEGRVW